MVNERDGASAAPSPQGDRPRDPLRDSLTVGRDSIEVAEWAGGLPQVDGTAPHIRLGGRWLNLVWLLPLGAVLGVVGVAIWNRHSTPGTEWFRFQKPVPPARPWTAKEDSVRLPGWFGLPGIRHSIGLARWWHFGFDTLWIVNGVVFYVLLFTTGQWQRIVPTSWDVIPDAISAAIQYLSLDFPANESWTAYNGLQLLTYFGTVFIAAPLAIVTGLMQSPAVANRFKLAGRLLDRQAARSLHVLVLVWMVGFILIHTVMVWTTGLGTNISHITTGEESASWQGFLLYGLWMAVVVVAWVAATPFTLRYPRIVQRVGRALTGPLMSAMEHLDPRPGEYTEQDISPFLWVNGKVPDSEEYAALVADGFRDYRLRVGGLVEHPVDLGLDELRSMPSQEQITQHFCIQGWSGVAKWGGVPMRSILELVKPLPEARYVAFYSLADGPDGGTYYDVHSLEGMRHELALLAYDMNGQPLDTVHGAPIRLRNEVELGFKMVKWVKAIELVADFRELGGGQGGYSEDHEFFGYRTPI